jgi:spore photoproduct lyase
MEDLLAELKAAFASPSIQRIGTGEFTDSLIWDRWIGLSRILVPAFSRQQSCVLELKTKTADVAALMGLPHHRKTVVAWSLNTPQIIEAEEPGSASLPERLEAARRCQQEGYPLAFHFDPMVIYDGCETAYAAVVEQLFASIHPENIVWISLGALRFPPALKTIMQKRHPRSPLVYGEFIRGRDKKMRYFKPLRIRLYREVARRIREFAPETVVYFCMEDEEVWEKALGREAPHREGVKAMLDAAAANVCGLGREKSEG